MEKIKLGTQGLIVPNIELSCMGTSKIAHFDTYGEANETESLATIDRSLELGGNFLDTADMYGPLENEKLIAKAIKGRTGKFIIATKFGFEIDDNGQLTWKSKTAKQQQRLAGEFRIYTGRSF